MVLDALARRATGGRLACDVDGAMARRGKVDAALLASEFLQGTPANVPSATGARRQVVLGKLSP